MEFLSSSDSSVDIILHTQLQILVVTLLRVVVNLLSFGVRTMQAHRNAVRTDGARKYYSRPADRDIAYILAEKVEPEFDPYLLDNLPLLRRQRDQRIRIERCTNKQNVGYSRVRALFLIKNIGSKTEST